ncbi:MAG: hypothetical protein NTW86_09865, partial [Candidatus Sumerlaeota bacterium]|nr:hypothetical protein [Candidatus Sumerlaeota bacterium]
QSRLLLPLVPFLYDYMGEGALWLWRRISPRPPGPQLVRRVMLGSTLAFLILMVRVSVHDWRHPTRDQVKDLRIGNAWIRENAPSDAIVMTPEPIPDYLYARRQTIAYPPAGADIQEYLAARHVSYILVAPRLQTPKTLSLDDSAEKDLLPFLERRRDQCKLVWRDPAENASVYDVSALAH